MSFDLTKAHSKPIKKADKKKLEDAKEIEQHTFHQKDSLNYKRYVLGFDPNLETETHVTLVIWDRFLGRCNTKHTFNKKYKEEKLNYWKEQFTPKYELLIKEIQYS